MVTATSAGTTRPATVLAIQSLPVRSSGSGPGGGTAAQPLTAIEKTSKASGRRTNCSSRAGRQGDGLTLTAGVSQHGARDLGDVGRVKHVDEGMLHGRLVGWAVGPALAQDAHGHLVATRGE